jgi:hypothetical protein
MEPQGAEVPSVLDYNIRRIGSEPLLAVGSIELLDHLLG